MKHICICRDGWLIGMNSVGLTLILFLIWAKMDGCQVTAVVFQCHQDILKIYHNQFEVTVFEPKKAVLRSCVMVKAPIDQKVLKKDD